MLNSFICIVTFLKINIKITNICSIQLFYDKKKEALTANSA